MWNVVEHVYWPEWRRITWIRTRRKFRQWSKLRILPPFRSFFISGMPAPTTTSSAHMLSTASSTLTSPSTSFIPAMCGASGMWFRATLRRISSPILPRLASLVSTHMYTCTYSRYACSVRLFPCSCLCTLIFQFSYLLLEQIQEQRHTHSRVHTHMLQHDEFFIFSMHSDNISMQHALQSSTSMQGMVEM